ncbi:F-box protein [Phanerochaete sordida]|uniref:F-box protein n=1 Tax=Phanerochaete sordida TaxID=48140 RepID=A0A9P3G5R8_9APHY|nr:F-box protein [Phanerochaete sordida]
MDSFLRLGHEGSPDPAKPAMHLNQDILLQIMMYLHRSDASRLSRTCRTLLQAAPQHLFEARLGTGGWPIMVELSEPRQFTSFFMFIFRRHLGCLRYLQVLKLSPVGKWRRVPRLAQLLAELFTKASALRALYLDDCSIIDFDERVRRAFTTMTGLRMIQIHAHTPDTPDWLEELQSPIACIDVDFELSDESGDRTDFVPVLEPFRTSLRAVKLKSIPWEEGPGIKFPLVFPNVASLEAEIFDLNWQLRTIYHCFPNVKELSTYSKDADGLVLDPEIEDIRLMNGRAQASGFWPSLRLLEGPLTELYMLAIQCAVDEVHTYTPFDTEVRYARLTALIAATRPKMLELRLSKLAFDFDLSTLAQHLMPARERLNRLELAFGFHGQEYTDIAPGINKMLSALAKFALHSLDIYVYWGDSYLRKPSPGGQSMADLDLAAMARHALQCMPSLRYTVVHGEEPLRRIVYEARGGPTNARLPVELEPGCAGWADFETSTRAHALGPGSADWFVGCPEYWNS